MSSSHWLLLTLATALASAPCLAQVTFDSFPSVPSLPSASDVELAGFRAFIWQHWIAQKRGIAQIRGISKEGAPSLVTYLVCPDEQGQWAITETWQSSGIGATGVFSLPPAVFVSLSLEVIENGVNSPTKVIPSPNTPFLNSFRLRFRRKTGDQSTF